MNDKLTATVVIAVRCLNKIGRVSYFGESEEGKRGIEIIGMYDKNESKE